jgi:hypothetical protein
MVSGQAEAPMGKLKSGGGAESHQLGQINTYRTGACVQRDLKNI